MYFSSKQILNRSIALKKYSEPTKMQNRKSISDMNRNRIMSIYLLADRCRGQLYTSTKLKYKNKLFISFTERIGLYIVRYSNPDRHQIKPSSTPASKFAETNGRSKQSC